MKILIARDKLLRALRGFFHERGFVEVQTPVRVAAPALENHVDAVPAHGAWLRTSPELHMKRLLAAGMEKIFQLGPCFRLGEHGKKHRGEFTMLEWYQAEADYHDLIPFTRDLVRAGAAALESELELAGDWEILTVHEAFQRYAGVAAEDALARDEFEQLLLEKIEPHLGIERPTILIDYPAELAAFARLAPDNPRFAERWELYINGLELANAGGELTDPVEQRRRFAGAAELRRKQGREVYPIDEVFLAALEHMPPAAGCALGCDRLLMALTNIADIADTLALPEDPK